VYTEPKYSERSINILDHPLVFYSLLIITLFATFFPKIFIGIPETFAGFNFTGWAWIIMLAFSVIVIFARMKLIRYYPLPFIGWILYLVLYSMIRPSFFGIQLTLQYLAMFATGMAASTYIYTPEVLKRIFKVFIFCIVSLLILYLFIPELDESAAVLVIFFTYAGILLLSVYFIKKSYFALFIYILLVYVTYLAVTRMAILLLILAAPLHTYSYGLFKRIMIFICMTTLGILLFESTSIQRKSFLSGSGNLSEISFENTNFRTSGRSVFYDLLKEDVNKNPLFGQGPRADLTKFMKNELEITEAHNDFLSVRYNYGWVGLILLIQGFVSQIYFLFIKKRFMTTIYEKVLFNTSLTAFFAWGGFMATDNILKYSTFFGNFHFCMIAMIYSIYKRKIFARKPNASQPKSLSPFTFEEIKQYKK
jgi:hypothetical protein